MNKTTVIISLFASFALASCSSIKPYQRSYLNDANMQSGISEVERFEQGVFNYREGAMTSGTKKGKGGCGCN